MLSTLSLHQTETAAMASKTKPSPTATLPLIALGQILTRFPAYCPTHFLRQNHSRSPYPIAIPASP
jgi:hypothetical protein